MQQQYYPATTPQTPQYDYTYPQQATYQQIPLSQDEM